MTQKEKAKAYEKALERAEKLQKTCDSTAVIGWCEYIFPELKESEGEKIRKTLVDYFDDANKADENPLQSYGIHTDKVIAWLEKQGNLMKALQISNARIGELIEENYYLKEQLEKQSANSVSVTKGNTSVTNAEVVSHPTVSTIIEPKFKVGDWVVTSYGKVNQVIAVDKDSDGFTLDDDTYFSGSWKDDYNLWSIQDAKAGDVLVCPKYAGDIIPNIFIFKNIYIKDNDVFCYCSFLETFRTQGYIANADPINTDFYPATKEQCDLLFQKMKEAGYVWDEGKKELKKIEQNPAWSEEDERICQCLICDQEKALNDVRNDKYGHSEIISDLKETYRERIDWLESLKQRYIWKPSKEQIDALDEVYKTHGANSACRRVLITLLNDLKELREKSL